MSKGSTGTFGRMHFGLPVMGARVVDGKAARARCRRQAVVPSAALLHVAIVLGGGAWPSCLLSSVLGRCARRGAGHMWLRLAIVPATAIVL